MNKPVNAPRTYIRLDPPKVLTKAEKKKAAKQAARDWKTSMVRESRGA